MHHVIVMHLTLCGSIETIPNIPTKLLLLLFLLTENSYSYCYSWLAENPTRTTAPTPGFRLKLLFLLLATPCFRLKFLLLLLVLG